MRIIHKLRMDLARCGCKPIVGAVQGEGNTRVLEISLFNNGIAWEAPAGATAAVAFTKPDGTKGLYDLLTDGSPATTISGSIVSATLAPQALTCAGTVIASIVFYDADMDTLATFPFKITVEANPAAGEQISNNYYKLQNFDQVNAAYTELTALVERLIENTDPTEMLEEIAAFEARVTAEMTAVNRQLMSISGYFNAEFEIGTVGVENSALVYSDSRFVVRTVEGKTYAAPAGTTFALTDYADNSLIVYYSYDGGVTYSSASGTSTKPNAITMTRDAVVAIKIQPKASVTLTDTSLSSLLVVNVPSIEDEVNEHTEALKKLSDEVSAVDNRVTDEVSAINARLMAITGDFVAEFEIGNVGLDGNSALLYSDSRFYLRTVAGKTCSVQAGTTFALTDYTDVSLVVYYSYDGGVTYSSTSSTSTNPKTITMEQAAVVAIKIQPRASVTLTDTSLSSLLVVGVPSILVQVAENSEAIKTLDTEMAALGTRVTAEMSAINTRLMHLNGSFSAEFEIGNVSVQDNALVYSSSNFTVRTKEGCVYEVPSGTSFALSDYTDLKLVIYYSYDGGATYSTFQNKEDKPNFVTEQDAIVALKIISTTKVTDTSLSGLLVVYVPTIENELQGIRAQLDSNQPIVEDLNSVELWESGYITSTGENAKDSSKLRTKDFLPESVALIYAEKDAEFYVAVYDLSGNYKGFWTERGLKSSPEARVRYFNTGGLDGCKFRLMIRRPDTTIPIEDYTGKIHLLDGLYKRSFTPKPTLTFIDDDGNANALENWESIADEIGIRITFALNTGNMEDGEHTTWATVERMHNKGFEFVSHTHKHINITTTDKSKVEEDFKATISALREHGCEPRYLVYPYNAIDAEKLPLVKQYFTAAVGLGGGRDNAIPLYSYELRRYSINDTSISVEKEYNGQTVAAHSFISLETLKGYIDTALVNGSWVIIMTHLRNDGIFYHDEESRQMIIDLCRYAAEKGMTIQTFGEAFSRYKNIMENGNAYGASSYYVVDCNGVAHHN